MLTSDFFEIFYVKLPTLGTENTNILGIASSELDGRIEVEIVN